MALVVLPKVESRTQGHPFLLSSKRHRTATTPISFCFFLLEENKQKVCHSFYLSLCVALCLVVSLHIVVVCYFYGYFFAVWRMFVVIDLLWALKRFGTYSFGIVSQHIEALATGGSCLWIVIINMNFVLFCWVWCFIAQMLWVHLCDFNATTMFLFMAIFIALVFSLH